MNDLRGRIAVQVDGGLRTGRDVAVGALLGADQFGFATAPLIASGCIMMRKCHLNTCPVGIATQDPQLRKKFTGTPEHVVNYFFFVAEEVRELMAEMGFRTFDEMIGQTEVLDTDRAIDHWKANGLDFSNLFFKPVEADRVDIHHTTVQNHPIVDILDRKFIATAQKTLDDGTPVQAAFPIGNTDRSAGTMLSGEVAMKYGHAGLPDDSIWFKLTGVAGQSFGAWVARGVTLELIGEANDYVGKGLSGGKLNTVLYGAVNGECYFRGIAGERFAVRNSGAIAVVEGAGDHGCEYMTGGIVVVLGETGRNFAAGMSGGIAYVLDESGDFERRCNLSMVDLEPVADEEEVMEKLHRSDIESHGLVDVRSDMTRFDAERLRQLIQNHVHYTASTLAQGILDNWDDYLPKFVKVMPVEYRRALQELQVEQTGEMNIGIRRG